MIFVTANRRQTAPVISNSAYFWLNIALWARKPVRPKMLSFVSLSVKQGAASSATQDGRKPKGDNDESRWRISPVIRRHPVSYLPAAPRQEIKAAKLEPLGARTGWVSPDTVSTWQRGSLRRRRRSTHPSLLPSSLICKPGHLVPGGPATNLRGAWVRVGSIVTSARL